MSTIFNHLKNKYKYRNVIPYNPLNYNVPEKMLDVTTAWAGHEKIILDIIQRFKLNTDICLEFGVEFGYSSVVFSNYFKKVIGVDIFVGDVHTEFKGNHYEETKQRLSIYDNIELVKMDYKEWIINNKSNYDLIHIDIVHTYEDTFKCGLWGAIHSKCAIFHDTESFPEVKRAVLDIAEATGKRFYNYPEHYGLGIIV